MKPRRHDSTASGVGGGVDAVPSAAPAGEVAVPADGEPTGETSEADEVRNLGSGLELVAADGSVAYGFEVPDGHTVHSYLVRPGASSDRVEFVVLVLEGETPVLHALIHDGDAASLLPFPEHLQPAHEVDAAPPMLVWTPDARSLVWTEPVGDGVVLRTVGWDSGPRTGREADDNATFPLGQQDVHAEGFAVTDGSWTLLLRPGAGGDPIELPVVRQSDGALALPN